MTYRTPPTPTHDDDIKVEEATSLLSGHGGGGAPAGTKTTTVPTMRAMIVTTVCVFLATLALLSGGRGGSSNGISTASSGSLAADLLRKAYDTSFDPSSDFCFADKTNPGHYCWYPTGNFPCPQENWETCSGGCGLKYGRTYNDCGRKCTEVHFSADNEQGYTCVSVVYDPPNHVYDPTQDYCFLNTDTVGKFCWYPFKIIPVGNWVLEGTHNENDCGPVCTAPPPNHYPPTPPPQDFCFTDNDYDGQYCWYPTNNPPHGNWELKGGRGFNDCGPKCGPCNNNENFRFNDDPEHGCNNWVWVDPEMHCDKVDPITNKPVEFFCPQFCKEKCKTRAAYEPGAGSDICYSGWYGRGECWNSFDEKPYPANEWVYSDSGECFGPMCTCGPECKEVRQFDPKQDHCYFDEETYHKNCWYPTTGYEPVGDWVEIGYAYGTTVNNEFNCGLKCTEVHAYDPTQDFCFHDKDNPWKYCWYPTDRNPSGNWEGKGGRGYNGCGPKCIFS